MTINHTEISFLERKNCGKVAVTSILQSEGQSSVFKLIGIIVAAVPIVLFLRAIFKGQLAKRSKAVSEFRKQMDYLVWVILFFIGCGVVYSIGKLIYQFLT
jgi:hypothetical protein